MDDIRNLPVFASSVGVIGTHLCDVDVGPVRNLIGWAFLLDVPVEPVDSPDVRSLLDLRRSSQGSRASKERRVGLLVSSPRQVVACLKVALDSGDIFVVFNSRSAEEHLHGGAVIALTTIQRTSEYITVLFRRSHCWGPTDSPELTVEEMEANTKVKVSAPAVMIISQAELRLVDQARESQRQLNEALERVRTLERNLEQQEQHTIRLHEANEQLRQRLEGGRSQASGSTRAPSPSQNSIRPDHRASDYWVPGDHNRPPSVFSTSSAPFVTAHSEPPSREAGFSHSYAGSYRASQFNVDTLDHRMSQASIEEAEEDVDDHFTLNSDDDPGTPTQTYIQPYVTDPYTTFNAPRANTLSPSPSYMSPAPSYRSEWRNESRRIASPGEASTSSSFGTMSNRLMPINETHPLPPTPPPEALATYIPPLSPHRTVGVPGHHCDLCPHEHPDFDFVPLDPCAHSFGRDCLKEYVEAQVLADIHPIYCPECVKRNVSPNITGSMFFLNLSAIDADLTMHRSHTGYTGDYRRRRRDDGPIHRS
jgi:TolA-binding protein